MHPCSGKDGDGASPMFSPVPWALTAPV